MKTIPKINFNKLELDELAQFIKEENHSSTKSALDSIEIHVKTAEKVDCKFHPEVKLMAKVFSEMKTLLQEHMMKEEHFLFPVVDKIGKTKKNLDCVNDIILIDGTIDELKSEHRKIKQLVAQLQMLCVSNPLSVKSSPSLKKFYSEFSEFEDQLLKNVFVENEILFPKLEKFGKLIAEQTLKGVSC